MNYLKNIGFILFAATIQILAQNQPPQVTNVTFTQLSDASLNVDINYDVNDADGDLLTITMLVSNDNGVTWNFSCDNISGDVGSNISSGTNKHIIWDFKTEHPETFGDQFKIKIIADDGGVIMGVPCPGIPTVTYEGKTYNTVQIGDQCWLKENLDVGTRIDGIQNANNNGVIEKYCYNNNPANCQTYGGLYQWDEAMQYVTNEGSKGICPDGWHIPTELEFEILKATVSNDGNALKEIGQGTGGGAGTNTSGFSALLAGSRLGGYYGDLSNFAIIWSSTDFNANLAKVLFLFNWGSNISVLIDSIDYGLSVRCIKDETSITQSCPGIPTVTYEGKTYNTVQIGDQCWLKENLDVGTRIDGIQNATDNGVIEKYCYNDNPANCETYGGLYQWDEAMQYTTNEGAQGICPSGWHMPKLSEFETLSSAVGGDGNALKEIGQGTGGGAGTNTSGFSALLVGFRDNDGYFYNLGISTAFWSSTEIGATQANFQSLYVYDSGIDLYYYGKGGGFSVRCLKD